MRDHYLSAEMMGVNLTKYRTMAFGISSFYAGIGGALYAHYVGFMSVEGLDILFSIQFLGMIDLLAARGFEAVALSPSGQETLSRLARPPRVAALFGTEGPGLPADVMARVRTVAIPMAQDFDSLNVATTSGIVLHHLAGV